MQSINKLFTLVLFAAPCLLAQVSTKEVANTPEPATIGLLATGLVGIGIAAWRRRRR